MEELIDVCVFDGECEFKRWCRLSHRGKVSPWMVPKCTWKETCNQKRAVSRKELCHSRALRQVRKHIENFVFRSSEHKI